MPIIIVTNRCFLSAERIMSMVMHDDTEEPRRNKTPISDDKRSYRLEMHYYPMNTGGSGYNPERVVALQVSMTGKQEADRLFRDVVDQIREQSPDEMFLNKLFEKHLGTDTPLPEGEDVEL
jgi:hypothetical protein